MQRVEINKLFENITQYDQQEITVCGWIRTVRDSKNIGFAQINDGSSFQSLQIVFEQSKLKNYSEIASLNVGAAIIVTGRVVRTPQARQPLEISASKIEVEGVSSPDYPLQKKRHTLEYLRTIGHLRARTNTYSAVFRVRSGVAMAIHRFFEEQGFVYVHTPIISSTDAEGAGEMFRVTTLDMQNVPVDKNGKVDFKQDFFEKPSYLTVSGQLQGEAMATALGKVYTFG
ncbi:MAG: amino acid--tRNA ligase-related protein, partial [Oscillospiraceae bacterium]